MCVINNTQRTPLNRDGVRTCMEDARAGGPCGRLTTTTTTFHPRRFTLLHYWQACDEETAALNIMKLDV